MSASDLISASADDDPALLETLRALEQCRIEAIRKNDVGTMAQVLDDKFLYINSAGEIYDKGKYLLAVRSHTLTYSIDRSEKRRVGKEGVNTCRSRWSPYP